MNFATSSQHNRWTFTAEKLVEIREGNREKAIDGIKQLRDAEQQAADPNNGEKKKKKGKIRAISMEDEKKLLRYYSGKIADFCKSIKLPVKVKTTAQTYLKRFYLEYSTLDHSPALISIACIYLAAKIEENYISAEQIGGLTRQKESTILAMEPVLLGGLKLDLIVYGPYRSLSSYMQDLEMQRSSGNCTELASVSEQDMKTMQDKANSACDVLCLTDAPLIFAPGQLALAALRSSMKNFPALFPWFFKRLIEGNASSGQEGGSAKLQEVLREIDRYGMEGAAALDAEEVKRIDRQLKACHNPLNDPNSEEYKKRKEAEKLKQAEVKAVKRAAKNSRIKSADLGLLGARLGPTHPVDPLLAELLDNPAAPSDPLPASHDQETHDQKRQKLNP